MKWKANSANLESMLGCFRIKIFHLGAKNTQNWPLVTEKKWATIIMEYELPYTEIKPVGPYLVLYKIKHGQNKAYSQSMHYQQ